VWTSCSPTDNQRAHSGQDLVQPFTAHAEAQIVILHRDIHPPDLAKIGRMT
jgi:hypothetical protein